MECSPTEQQRVSSLSRGLSGKPQGRICHWAAERLGAAHLRSLRAAPAACCAQRRCLPSRRAGDRRFRSPERSRPAAWAGFWGRSAGVKPARRGPSSASWGSPPTPSPRDPGAAGAAEHGTQLIPLLLFRSRLSTTEREGNFLQKDIF